MTNDIQYYMTVAQYELMELLQAAVQRNWVFTFDHGERKFQSNRASAKKDPICDSRGKIAAWGHEVDDCDGWDEMFRKIGEIDAPIDYIKS